MSSSVSGTLRQLLAMVESQQQPEEAEKPESTATKKLAEEAEEEEGPAAEEEVEMAKMLCSLSQQGVAENDQQQQPPKTDDDCDSGEVEKMDLDLADEDQKPTEISFKEEFVKKEPTERSLAQPISVQISPIQQKRQNSADEKIRKDANFSSFAEFEQAFEEWKQSYHHPFRVASSEKHEDRELAARFKYRYVVYHCSRYGEPRKRGAGRRPHQNYLLSKKKSNNTKIVAPSPSRPCGCNAKLRLNFHAQNEGSLCVTTLVTEHNHAPASSEEGGNNASGFGLSSMKKSRKCSPGDDSSGEGCDHSPNSTASSIAHAVMTMTAGPLSPLSLQSALNHSPSSGGQSSSEGAAAVSEALGLSLNTLLAAHHCQMQLSSAAMAEDNKNNSMQKLMLANSSNYSPHSKQPQPSLISPLAKSNGALSAFLAKAHLQQQQQQQQNNQQSRNHAEPSSSNLRHSALGSSGGGSANDLFSPSSRQSAPTMVEQLQQQALLPLIHDLLRSGQKQPAPATNTEHHQNQLLLSLLLSPQQRQQQQQQRKEQQQPNNMASNSSILASLQQSLQQQNSNVSSASAHTSPSSLLSANPQLQHAVLQLQLQQLINKTQQQQQGQATAGSSSSSNGHNSQSAAAAKAQLLQQLLGQHAQRGGVAGFGGQQMQQQQTQQHRNAHPLAMAALHFGGKHEIVDNTIAQTRTEMVQEADLLLQALVSQMIRAQDLHTYLRRLRQFLTENCD